MMTPYRLVRLSEMLELPIGRFVDVHHQMVGFQQLFTTMLQTGIQARIPGADYQAIVNDVERMVELCGAMDFPVSKGASQTVLVEIKGAVSNGEKWDFETHIMQRCLAALQQFTGCIRNEANTKAAIVIQGKDIDLYEQSSPSFGVEVDSAFPDSSEDIEEAGKCLALGRNTAAVFHLSRGLEAAVQKLSDSLGIPNPDREWGKLLADIKIKIEAMPKGNVRNEWSENFSLLYHVKQAWRNEVMHPKKTYTSEQAMEVYNATRSFMRNLISLL